MIEMPTPSATIKWMHHAWIVVLLVGVIASFAIWQQLMQQEDQSLRMEIKHRSLVKLHAVQSMLQQHVDAFMTAAFFAESEIRRYGHIDERNAGGFLRSMLARHPNEIVAMAMMPTTDHGDMVFVSSNNKLRSFDPPLDMAYIRQLPFGATRLILTHTQHHQPQLRLITAISGSVRGYAIADLNIHHLVTQAVAQGQPFGLDVTLSALEQGHETLLIKHVSRSRQGATEKNETKTETWNWHGNFEVGGLNFVLHTHAAPSLVAQFLSWRPLAALCFGLVFSQLVALILFKRSRYSERLQTLVNVRTAELETEQKNWPALLITPMKACC